MPLKDYSIRDRNGDRIPANECHIQPLNFFLPGNAPILVPKRTGRNGHTAAPATNKAGKKRSSGCKLKELGNLDREDGYGTDSDSDDEDVDEDAQPLLGKKTVKSKLQTKPASTAECKKSGQKHNRRVKKQAQASEATHPKTELSARKRKHNKCLESSSEGDESATDTSAKVRDILASLKIRAAGLDVDDTFTPSEEFQLLVLKKNGETWNDISETMKRPKNQVKKHYKHLKSIGTKIPGEDDDDAAAACKSSEDIGVASDTGAIIASSSSDEKSKDNKKTKSLMTRKKLLKKQPPSPPKIRKRKKEGAQPAATATSSPAEPAVAHDTPDSDALDKTGIKAYIGQYATQLIKDHRAGRVTLPEPDDTFDEDDCVLLALANNRHATDRWLHIQAEFANLTGRLVPEQVLKWKLGERDKPDSY